MSRQFSDKPIGYVFDASVGAQPDTELVYPFYPKEKGARPRYVYRTDSADWGGWEVTDEATAVAKSVPDSREPGFFEKIAEIFGAEKAGVGGYTPLPPMPAQRAGWVAPTLAWKPARRVAKVVGAGI